MKTIREIEKEYGMKFDEKRNITLAEWLEKIGIPALAKALKIIEDKKPCTICRQYDCNSIHDK